MERQDLNRMHSKQMQGRTMAGFFVVSSLFVLLSLGCTSSWSLRIEPADFQMQWPPQPDDAKITYVSALKGFSGSNAPASLLRAVVYGSEGDEKDSLGLPVAIAVGHDDRLAVADTGLRCVHLYIPSGQKYLRIKEAGALKLISPVGVIFDDDNRLYVSDSALGKVFIFDKEGEFLSAIDHAGTEPLKRPTGLAYSPVRKLLYVVDTLANMVHAFNSNGMAAFSFGGRGEEKGHFNFPTHIFRSSKGVLYVTDAMNFRIQTFDESGAFISSFGNHGDGFGDLARPKGVAADRDGLVYIADNLFDNVQLFDSNGVYLLTLSKRGYETAEFWMPSGLYIDGNDTLYVCDTYNRRIQIFRLTGGRTDAKR
jgi:DNA-binding beta-propeller fold protein YncE